MIRPPAATDAETIGQILDRAFAPSVYEARLRSSVANGGGQFAEWVAERDGRVVAYVLYTPATDGDELVGWHLAPVAVDPEFQRQGIGSQLIRESLATCPIGDVAVFVLGDPRYYERFGFGKQTGARCPFDESGEHFRALRWADARAPFEIGYASAFIDAGSE